MPIPDPDPNLPGDYQYKNCDKYSGGTCISEHSTFEDIDGFEVVTSAEGRFAIILEGQ